MNRYEIYWVGGERDGEVLAEADTAREAEQIAKKLEEEYKEEFHPTWGGIGIANPDGTTHEW